MSSASECGGHLHSTSHDLPDRHLHARVIGEFREMPGLTLTLAQAARLFSLERDRCERVLKALVQHGVLVRRGESWRAWR